MATREFSRLSAYHAEIQDMRTPLKLLFIARKMQLASASGILCMIVTKRMTLNYVSKVSKYPIDAARLIVYIKRRKVLVWIDYYNPNY